MIPTQQYQETAEERQAFIDGVGQELQDGLRRISRGNRAFWLASFIAGGMAVLAAWGWLKVMWMVKP